MSVLIIAEHNNSELHPATLATIAAGLALGETVDCLVVGSNCQAVADSAAAAQGVAKVLLADSDIYAHQLAENVAPLVQAQAEGYTHILAAATTTGKNLMPRVAALLDVMQISDVTGIESADTFQRPIYAGNVIATVQSADSVKILTVRTTAFDAVAGESGSASITTLDAGADSGLSEWLSDEVTESDRPDLTAADIVISGGRGMGSSENFALLEGLADKLGAAIGASRAAVDAGYVSNDMQVGQTGKIVAPKLYMAVGISGAIQHLAGMKDSKVIVAINKDEEAPIFQVADYGIVGDLFEIIPQISAELDALPDA